ncbi:MAG TPA: GtrA family protein [Solirubrobacterales bacterium]|jgi:dolichol-phosphate mannosyltransferase
MSGGHNSLAVRLHAAARQPDNWIQLLKFGVVGGSGYVINLVVFAFLAKNLGVYHAAAAVGAFFVALGNNFFWNRHWTFGPGEGLAHEQAIRFTVVSVGALVINLIVLEVLVRSSSISELAAQAIAVAVAMPFNFLGNKLWTFN